MGEVAVELQTRSVGRKLGIHSVSQQEWSVIDECEVNLYIAKHTKTQYTKHCGLYNALCYTAQVFSRSCDGIGYLGW